MNIILARILKLVGLYNEKYKHFKGFEFSKYIYTTNTSTEIDFDDLKKIKPIDIYYRTLDAYMIDENQFKIKFKLMLLKVDVFENGSSIMYKGDGIALFITQESEVIHVATISRGVKISYVDIFTLQKIIDIKFSKNNEL